MLIQYIYFELSNFSFNFGEICKMNFTFQCMIIFLEVQIVILKFKAKTCKRKIENIFLLKVSMFMFLKTAVLLLSKSREKCRIKIIDIIQNMVHVIEMKVQVNAYHSLLIHICKRKYHNIYMYASKCGVMILTKNLRKMCMHFIITKKKFTKYFFRSPYQARFMQFF